MLGQPHAEYPSEVVVAADTRDDAAVYRLPDGTGLVQTVDFFTPVVDDPYDWGRIGCANAVSDVYAMGGRPVLALNIAAWPVEELPLEMLRQVLEGGAHVAAEAGVSIVGGHTIHDPEPKYGMAVTGFVDLEKVVRNSTAPPDARLFLTKPLGIGLITTALKRGEASEEQVKTAVDTMTTLNRDASEAMVEAGVAAATDVTGYGLLGHLHFMLAASGVSAEIDAAAVPLLAGVHDLAERGLVASGSRKNHAFLKDHVDWGELRDVEQLVLADAQTSGGLLIAAAGDQASRLVEGLARRGVAGWEIGRTREGHPGGVTVRGRVRGE